MSKNTGNGYRKGSVNSRSQFKVGQQWVKRDTDTGRIMDTKVGEPFKGVPVEKDGRRS